MIKEVMNADKKSNIKYILSQKRKKTFLIVVDHTLLVFSRLFYIKAL